MEIVTCMISFSIPVCPSYDRFQRLEFYEHRSGIHTERIRNIVGSSSMPLLDSSKGLALSLTKEEGGTRMSSTKSLLYGNVTARINTDKSLAGGVVTAFILIVNTYCENLII